MPVSPSLEIRGSPEPVLGRRISATTLYVLQKCERRLWLGHHRPELAAPPGDFERMLAERGREHERGVRESRFASATGPVYVGQPAEQAAAETLRRIAAGHEALYQPLLLSSDGERVGVPDFLLRENGSWVVHDVKLAVNLAGHPEIGLQMTHYARLVCECLSAPAARLEITDGNGEQRTIPDLPEEAYARALERVRALSRGGAEPLDLLSTHSVCADCPFYGHCWPLAVEQDRIEVLREVTRSVAAGLHAAGIRTIERLARAEPGQIRMRGIAGTAEAIVAEARAHRERRPVWLAPPRLPPWPVVWFDLEGDPEGEEVDRAIYLWGLAVDDGASTPRPVAITADFGDRGGERAWERFVALATEILDRHPQARWVHYSPYERTWVRKYASTYGAPPGFLERLDEALYDLLYRGVRRSVRLPLYSYSVKKVADFVGFRWRNPASGSLWSIVQYARARACGDTAERARLLREIEEYNADDLLAMRAVWRWLLAEGPKEHCG